MTLTGPDGSATGPFTADDLTAASAQVVDPLTARAAEIVVSEGKCSASFIQRQLAIGYNGAARICDALEGLGVISAADHVGKRRVLVSTVPKPLQLAATAQKMVSDAAGGEGQFPAIRDHSRGVAAAELRQFIERYERLDAEKSEIAALQKEVMAEAKGRGYDTRVMRRIIALRKRDADDVAEEEALLEMYKAALGMG